MADDKKATAKKKLKGAITPIGEFVHPWLTTPDTKYNDNGIWHTGLLLEGDDAQEFKKLVDEAVDAFYAARIEELPKKKAEEAKKYYPYDEEIDEGNGQPTGRIKFVAKQNAVVTLKDKTEKHIELFVTDSKGTEIKLSVVDKKTGTRKALINVWNGTRGRLSVLFREVYIEAKPKDGIPCKIGTQLSLAGVQIVELKTGGGGPRFGAVEGGFVAEDADASYEADGSDEDTPY